MILSKIIIEGFGSIVEPLEYKLDNPGITILQGNNGAGKSTIVNAIAYALYKQQVKKGASLLTWPELRPKDYRGLKVHLFARESNTVIEVIRCLEYTGKVEGSKGGNRLIIKENGKPLDNLRDKSDGEKWIKDKFGYSFELFKNTLFFGQGVTRLSKEDGTKKKQIFEEAFDTVFITKAREIAAKRLDAHSLNREKLKSTVEVLKQVTSSLKSTIHFQKDFIKNWKTDRDKKITTFKENLSKYKDQLKKWTPEDLKLKDLNKTKRAVDELEEEIEKYSSRDFKLSMEKSGTEHELQTLQTRKSLIAKGILSKIPKCPECGSILDEEASKLHKRKLKKELDGLVIKQKELKKSIFDLEIQLKKIKRKLEMGKLARVNLNKKLSKITAHNIEVEKQINDKINIESHIEEITFTINSLKKEKPPKTKDLSGLQGKLKNNREKIKKSKEEIKLLTKAIKIDEWLIKDPLSNSGLKSFIFDSMLAQINHYAMKYQKLTKLGARIYIDMESAHKNIKIAVVKQGKEVPYDDLSGGERQLVDITIALSFNDTLSQVKPLNILFLDEWIESLDEDNIEIVGNIILEKAKTKSIQLISHQSKFIPSNSLILKVSKDTQGYTTVA